MIMGQMMIDDCVQAQQKKVDDNDKYYVPPSLFAGLRKYF